MSHRFSRPTILAIGLMMFGAFAVPSSAQTAKPQKAFMVTDMEGVAGIFNSELQCMPWKSPRWEESRKLLTGEVNAAVKGLFEGGATCWTATTVAVLCLCLTLILGLACWKAYRCRPPSASTRLIAP